MKKILFFACYMINSNLYSQDQSKETICAQSLKATCTIKIMQEKLSQVHNTVPIESRVNEAGTRLQKIYQECASIINSHDNNPEQSDLTEFDWINKSLREIYTLQHDDQTRNCFNQALSSITSANDHKIKDDDTVIQLFFDSIENCSYQHGLKISRPHLDAQIERWKKDDSKKQYDRAIWQLLLKHSSEKQDDFEQDVAAIYHEGPTPTMIPLKDFSENMNIMLKKLYKNIPAQSCLQDIINFQNALDATPDKAEQENLKNSFAINYLKCKNL